MSLSLSATQSCCLLNVEAKWLFCPSISVRYGGYAMLIKWPTNLSGFGEYLKNFWSPKQHVPQ